MTRGRTEVALPLVAGRFASDPLLSQEGVDDPSPSEGFDFLPAQPPLSETLDDARRGIGAYVDRYHHRPHSGLDYRTPLEVRQTWEDHQNIAA